MKRNAWIIVGASVAAAGVLMLGVAYVTPGTVNAGIVVCNPTPTPVILGQNGRGAVGIAAVQVAPTCTATPVRIVRTATPTFTPTAKAQTATPVPPTSAPPSLTSTPKPSSGNEGVAVRPPNTGSGGSMGGNLSLWLLVLGAASVAAGSGAVLVGVRRR